METNNYAAIDIGSNAARLLIKNVTEDSMGNAEFTKLLFLRIPLRLGKDVFTLGEISEERQRMMMCMIKSYKQLMKLYRVECFRACATSAMRDARNGEKLLKKRPMGQNGCFSEQKTFICCSIGQFGCYNRRNSQ